MKSDYLLEIEDLSVSIEGKILIRDLNLKIPYGEVHALLGVNGSGKSTLMKTIMGYPKYKVDKGRILFKGQDITDLEIDKRAGLGIGIAEQRPPVIQGLRLKDLMSYIHTSKNNPINTQTQVISDAGMTDFMDRDINKDFSGGEIKRAELMQLLALNPTFSMMDEPDSGVDIESLKNLGHLINRLFKTHDLDCQSMKEAHKSGLIVTHYGNILDHIHVDKAHVMFMGRIGCSGHPKKILETIKNYGYEECVCCLKRGNL